MRVGTSRGPTLSLLLFLRRKLSQIFNCTNSIKETRTNSINGWQGGRVIVVIGKLSEKESESKPAHHTDEHLLFAPEW